MSKSKIALAAVGGVSAVAVLAMCAVLWLAFSAKTVAIEGDMDEGTEGLDSVVGAARQLSSGKVYPGPESVKAIKSDIDRLDDWRAGAMRFASRGDRVFEKTTPPAFKSFIVRDAKRLSSLAGAVAGALVKPDFDFGPFKPYISEGKMPEEARLAELQRRWDDISGFAETLSANGVSELVSVAFRDSAADAEKDKDKGRNDARQNRNRRGAKQAESKPSFKTLSHSYVVVFRARPNALVKVVNAIASGERFVVVDSLSFGRGKDALLVALGGEDKGSANAVQQQSSRRRRRRGDDVQPKVDQAAVAAAAMKDGIVTDPLLDEPLDVTLAFTVHDFNSLVEEEKGASK